MKSLNHVNGNAQLFENMSSAGLCIGQEYDTVYHQRHGETLAVTET